MSKKWGRKGLAALLVLVLVIAAGCQAIGGVDVSKAMLSMFEMKSLEGSATITLEAEYDESQPLTGKEAEDVQELKALLPLTLQLDHIKQESLQTASVSGTLEIKRGKIPFTASITPEQVVVKVDGLSRPIVIPMAGNAMPASAATLPVDLGALPEALNTLQTKMSDPEFQKPIYSYFINGMPNPKNIKVDSVSEPINGQNVSLFKVQAGLNGTEIVPWLKSFIVNLMQDDQGLKAVVAQLYDAIKPVMDAIPKKTESDDEAALSSPINDMFGDIFGGLMEDRTTAIEVLHTEAKQVLVILLAMLNSKDDGSGGALGDLEGLSAMAGGPSAGGLGELTSRSPGSLEELLGAGSHVQGAIYVDSSLHIRKAEGELVIAPTLEENGGIKALKLRFTQSNWNVNQPVKADVLEADNGIDVSGSGSYGSDVTKDIIKAADSKSTLYGLLKQDLHLMRKTVRFDMMFAKYMPPEMQPYMQQDTAMAPARYLAEELGATISWDSAKRSVTITDPSTGSTFVTAIGSDFALINGKAVTTPGVAEMKDDIVYVPIRPVVDALGAKIEWDNDTQVITITKD